MGRPWRPKDELDGALERGSLAFAKTLARELASDHGRPIDLDAALRFLPLVAREEPQAYSTWALRWLVRWASEAPGATIDAAAEVAAQLAELPNVPSMLEDLQGKLGP